MRQGWPHNCYTNSRAETDYFQLPPRRTHLDTQAWRKNRKRSSQVLLCVTTTLPDILLQGTSSYKILPCRLTLDAKNLQSVRKRQAKDFSVVLHSKSSLCAASRSRTESSAEREGAGEGGWEISHRLWRRRRKQKV
jgi:hypothetical protein